MQKSIKIRKNSSGGLTSFITGGDPLQGVVQGLVVYFANHLAHDGGEDLQEKLDEWYSKNKESLISFSGNADVEKIWLATKGVLNKFDFSNEFRINKKGIIYNKKNEQVNDFTTMGKATSYTSDNCVSHTKNNIIVSKNIAIGLFNNQDSALETIRHEWKHANMWFSGQNYFIHQNYIKPYDYMELQVREFMYQRYKDDKHLYEYNYFLKLYNIK